MKILSRIYTPNSSHTEVSILLKYKIISLPTLNLEALNAFNVLKFYLRKAQFKSLIYHHNLSAISAVFLRLRR